MNLNEMIQIEIAKTQATLKRYGLPTFDIPFSVTKMSKSKCIAFAHYAGHLEFNEAYFSHCEGFNYKETIAHEVCHLYQFKYFPHAKQGHGPEFRSLMRKCGYEGTTKAVVTGKAAMVSAAKTKTKTRHIYITANSKKEVMLTVQQHKKEQLHIQLFNRGRYNLRGEALTYTKKVKKFK